MAEEIYDVNLAESQSGGEEAAHEETHQAGDAHAGAEESHGEPQDVFQQLYKQMGDHPGFYYGPFHVADLPVIIYDEGLHFYWNPHDMEEAGLFTMEHHHIVSADDHEPVALDISVSNLIVFQWIMMVVLGIIFWRIGSKYKKNPTKAPSGFANAIESTIVYVRDEIVVPNLPTRAIADRLLGYFIALFFFILACNMFGLVPGGHTPTGTLGVTGGLSITAFIVINWTSIRESGVGNYFKHLLGGAPWWLFPIMIPIEVLSMFIKPFALTVRLFANMSAGHIILLSLLGLLFYFGSIIVSPAIVGFSVFILLLELLVVFIQAYVFTMLTAIFVGLAVGEHEHGAHELDDHESPVHEGTI